MTSETHRSESETRELLDAYREFRLSPDASPRAIKHRYRLLAKKWHPDRYTDRLEDLALAKEKMRTINASYRCIKDAPLRGAKVNARTAPRPSRPRATPVDWEPEWERPCPNCGKKVRVHGERYAQCDHCGVGFFPTVEGNYEAPQPVTFAQKVATGVYFGYLVLIVVVGPLGAAIGAAISVGAACVWYLLENSPERR